MSEKLKKALEQIERQYGKGAAFRYGDGIEIEGLKTISTGSLQLDRATGVRGVPLGRIVEVFGPESSGKTTLCLHIIASAQKAGMECAFIDAEHALDMTYAKKIGVDPDKVIISQPDNGEMALDIAEQFTIAQIPVIVIDSVAALVPKAEVDGDFGDAQMGLHARLMSQAMRKLAGSCSKNDVLMIFVNQIREKIGVIWGNPETTTGGRALKFYSSIRIDVRRTGNIKDGENVVGVRTKAKVVKNKVAPPFKQAEFAVYFGKGIDVTGELIDLAVEHNIIQKSGTWYSFGEERLGQGMENAKIYLEENDDLMKILKKEVLGE